MKKINIMFLYSAKGFGGMVRNLTLLVNNLDKDKFDITVVSLANQGDDDSDIKIEAGGGITFVRIEEKKKLDMDSVLRIDSLIREKGIDILSCHGYKADVYGFVLRLVRSLRRDSRKTHPPRNDSEKQAKRGKLKMVAMVHGWTMSGVKVELYYILDKLVLRAFDKIILVADGLRSGLKGWMIPANKIEVVYNAIPPVDEGAGDGCHDIRRSFEIDDKDMVIGSAGRLSREKDLGTALFAMKELVLLGIRSKLMIVGDGPEKEHLLSLANKLGLGKSVIFAGFQKDTGMFYRAFDIYLSTSIKEGLPNSVLEAQARGIPCIVTNIRGNNDIVKDGLNGLLFKPGDHKELSERVLALLNDKAMAEKFAGMSREVIRNNFSLAKRMEKLEGLYFTILNHVITRDGKA